MKTKSFLIAIILMISLSKIYGQKIWEKRYNSPTGGQDNAVQISTDNFGDVYVLGKAGSLTDDIVLLKYSIDGQEQHVMKYDGGHTESPFSMVVDKVGNIYVTGIDELEPKKGILLKFNSNGENEWAIKPSIIAMSITLDINNYLFVTGYSGSDLVMAKYNSTNGAWHWEKRYRGAPTGDNFGKKVLTDPYGNIYVIGFGFCGETDFDFITLKYNSDGILQWEQQYTNGQLNAAEHPVSFCLDKSYNVYVTGFSDEAITGRDIVTIKYSTDGELQWIKRYNSPSNLSDSPDGIVIDDSNYIYVAGHRLNYQNEYDIITIKYDSNGNQKWFKAYDGIGHKEDLAFDISIDNEDNIYVVGKITGQDETNTDGIILMYDSAGNQKEVVQYNGPGNGLDEIKSIALDDSNYVYVAGKSAGIDNSNDIVTIKYKLPFPPNEVKSIKINKPYHFQLYPSYPNPFNQSTLIKFEFPEDSYIKLEIYNLLGEKVRTLVNERKNAGFYEIEWNGKNNEGIILPSGVYLCILSNNEHQQIQKMILAK